MKKLFLVLVMLLLSTTCYGWSDNDYPDEHKAAVEDVIANDDNANGIPDTADNAGLPDAPADGAEYLRKDGAWAHPTSTGTGDGTGTDDQTATEVPVTTTAFGGHLANDATSDTVQECLDLLDDIVGGNSITNLTVTSSTSPSITGNTIIDNSGQSGSITTTMPACPSETMFVQFIITTPAYTWYIEPATDENFYLNGTEFDANHMIVNNGAAAIFQDSVMFMSKEDASSNWVWIVYTIQGTWTDGGL